MRYVSIAKDTYLGTRQCCFLRKTGIDRFYFLIKTAKHFSQAMQAMCGQESWTTAKRDRKICNCYHYGGKTYHLSIFSDEQKSLLLLLSPKYHMTQKYNSVCVLPATNLKSPPSLEFKSPASP